MSRRILVLCGVVLVVAVLAVYLPPTLGGGDQKADAPSLLVSGNDIPRLRAKAESGDCGAALLLARHYLNEALQLDTGTKWLRVAARCPNTDVKALWAGILMHKGDDPAVRAEIAHLIEEIRESDPGKADQLESERKGMQGSH